MLFICGWCSLGSLIVVVTFVFIHFGLPYNLCEFLYFDCKRKNITPLFGYLHMAKVCPYEAARDENVFYLSMIYTKSLLYAY